MYFFEIAEPVDRQELEKGLAPFLTFIASGEPITPKHIAKQLHNTLKKYGVGEVGVEVSDNVDSGDMNLNAAYDPFDDEDELEPFTMDLIFSSKDKTLEFTPEGVDNIKDRILDALEHEMIHMRQYRSRDFVKQRKYKTKSSEPDVKRAKEYLGNDDEIEAFAKNIAAELVRNTGSKDKATDLLRSVNTSAGLKDEMGYLLSPNLLGYMAVWGFNTKHPVIRKLLKKVYFSAPAKKPKLNK